MSMQVAVSAGILDRVRIARAADWLAVAVAVSLPWSTSASGVLIALWLVAVIPTLDLTSLRRALAMPAAAIPAALVLLGLVGMTWADASFAEKFGSFKPFLRLLIFPLLFIQFRNSDRGMWVVAAFLVSCTGVLALSWLLAIFPDLSWRTVGPLAVPVKDYIIQSGEFLLCAFALTHLAISAWQGDRRRQALAFALLAFAFLTNIVYVATARSTVVIFAALLPVLAFQRFEWKRALVSIAVGVVLAAVAWNSSPYLRGRVLAVEQEIQQYQTENQGTSSGWRLEFWKKSIRFIADAPLFGHGTGSVMGLFRNAATGESGPSASVTDQPHNQTLIIAIQLGLLGTALLFAMWLSHLLLFRVGALVTWLGTGVVVQSIVACLFNSYLFEFTLGWIYIFGVGVLGGMVLRHDEGAAGKDPDSAVARGDEGR